MLNVKNITKFYGQKKVLDDISFSIKEKELTVLLGPSGSGKTTVLKIIAGLENLYEGKVFVNKKIMSKENYYLPPNKRKINMVFQDLALWPHMDVEEHIAFSISSTNLDKQHKEKRINKILKRFKLEKHKKSFPTELSGGEKQRLAIARAISTDPKILLLDEPLVNLDLTLKTNIQKLLIKLNKEENVTIFYVTHDQIEALMMAKKIIVIKNGKVQQVGTPYSLINEPASKFVEEFLRFDYDYIRKLKRRFLL